MVMDFLNAVAYWHWLVFGLVLIMLEIFVPAAVFLWPGIAALAVGVLSFAAPGLGWMPLLLIWAVLSMALAFGWQFYKKTGRAGVPSSTINRRGEQYVGRHFTLAKDIVNNVGELRVDDTSWKIVSNRDFPAGTKVKVTAVEGTSLRVEEFIS
jgi:membrane protein implicated in regulation of membrane protease activity